MFKGYGNYDKAPAIKIVGHKDEVWQGYDAICSEIENRRQGKESFVVVLDLYPGVYAEEVLSGLAGLKPSGVYFAEDCMQGQKEYENSIQENLTDDRVLGVLTEKLLEDYYIGRKLEAMRKKIHKETGLVLVYGVGASLVTKGDILIYFDLARWEIQLRYRNGMGNFHGDNGGDPQLSKYKRGYFVDWRLADRHKVQIMHSADYIADTNIPGFPKMITKEVFFEAVRETASRPFRLVPYFDPGVWGGQWMKQVCCLPEGTENYAWSFDGVPEENSILLDIDGTAVELPAMDAVLFCPKELLGQRVYERFGAEFPIRFDLLDTMQGQNLSLQVHPLKEYIKEKFNMDYTQDESYYMLDCEDDACVYLGIKTGTDREEMLADLRAAQNEGKGFDAEKYINKIPVKKHDHVSIPSGTIHCSGKNAMVLEISATPYIFTFKLWDWDRLGLDGLPRPVHLDHGEKNIQWDRDTKWVQDNLLNQTVKLQSEWGITAEETGLHPLEFIKTVRHTFKTPVSHNTQGSVNVLNLVQGKQAEVYSPSGAFKPFTVHYAETFIIPASVGEYMIKPSGDSGECMTIKASVK